jgi:hypothetical protein
MSGDEKSRFCTDCNLKVYNPVRMTDLEVTALVAQHKGRLCMRLYRRNDGTVLTRDCPVGLARIRRRLSRAVAAVFAAVIGFVSIVNGQKQPGNQASTSDKTWTVSPRPGREDRLSFVSGKVQDTAGALVPGAKVTLKGSGTDLKTVTNDEGVFEFTNIRPGDYSLTVTLEGLSKPKPFHVQIRKGEDVNAVGILDFSECTVLVGVVGFEPLIDTSVPGGTTVLKGELLRRPPF